MQEILEQSALINPNLKINAVLTMCSTNPIVGEKNDSIEYLDDFPNIKLANSVIGDRKVYRDSTNQGMGVTEMLSNTSASAKRARAEINSLIKELL
ncbi:hypothetical protein BMR08_14000 [Methylococcaceae bacterium CS2]|nr:hypothetical protein BMR09_14955 [Methylococcaceae bacterium CS3]TXL08579.1 hypothetical protein BMR08_14000 [Methylococcaceae bacterium CS2]